jgi:LAS superfamily LD-carboxypeptidase LdcB
MPHVAHARIGLMLPAGLLLALVLAPGAGAASPPPCALEPTQPVVCTTRCAGGTLAGDSLFARVTRQEALRSDWAPPDLVIVPAAYRRGDATRMRLGALGHMLRMLKDARGGGRAPIFCGSPYRSFNEQCTLFAQYASWQGCEKANIGSAMAGHSEHQLGTVCDLVLMDDSLLRGDGSIDEWLSKHAHEYGFVQSYPEGTTPVTGYKTEPWHFRYVGIKAAALHKRMQLAAGHPLSSHELVASVACWPQKDLDELAEDDPVAAAAAGRAVCDEYHQLSMCQSGATLMDCSAGVARLVPCPHRCVTHPHGVADACN